MLPWVALSFLTSSYHVASGHFVLHRLGAHNLGTTSYRDHSSIMPSAPITQFIQILQQNLALILDGPKWMWRDIVLSHYAQNYYNYHHQTIFVTVFCDLSCDLCGSRLDPPPPFFPSLHLKSTSMDHWPRGIRH